MLAVASARVALPMTQFVAVVGSPFGVQLAALFQKSDALLKSAAHASPPDSSANAAIATVHTPFNHPICPFIASLHLLSTTLAHGA